MLKTRYIKVETKGNTDIIDITPYIEEIVKEENVKEGIIFEKTGHITLPGVMKMPIHTCAVHLLKQIFSFL